MAFSARAMLTSCTYNQSKLICMSSLLLTTGTTVLLRYYCYY